MSKDLEFHYVVSYRDGFGWSIAADTEDALFTEGTVYDWKSEEWLAGYEDDEENDGLNTIDLSHYSVLCSTLNLLNEGAIPNA
jgi:hypothetical protein